MTKYNMRNRRESTTFILDVGQNGRQLYHAFIKSPGGTNVRTIMKTRDFDEAMRAIEDYERDGVVPLERSAHDHDADPLNRGRIIAHLRDDPRMMSIITTSLSERERRVFIERYMWERPASARDIAREMGISLNTAYAIAARALKKVREAIG